MTLSEFLDFPELNEYSFDEPNDEEHQINTTKQLLKCLKS